MEKLPKQAKYTLGSKILKDALELFDYIQLANLTLWKEGKKKHLENFIVKFSLVKVSVRLCVDLHYITLKQHAQLLPFIDNIGKQATAWKNSFKDFNKS